MGVYVQYYKRMFAVWSDTRGLYFAANGWSWQSRTYITIPIKCSKVGSTASTQSNVDAYFSLIGSADNRYVDLTTKIPTARPILREILESSNTPTATTNAIEITNEYANTRVYGYAGDSASNTIKIVLLPNETITTMPTLYAKYTDTTGASAYTQFTDNNEWVEVDITNIDYTKGLAITDTEPTPTPTPTYSNNVTNTTDTETQDGDNAATITITANSGYQIDTASVEYVNTSGTTSTAEMTIASDKGSASVSITDVDFATTIQINGSTSEIPPTPTITNNVDNTTFSYSDITSDSVTITLVANSGYQLDTAKIAYTTNDGYPTSKDMTISADLSNATLTISSVDFDKTISINGSTSEKSYSPTFSNNVANTTYTYTQDGDNAVSVTLTASNGFEITTASVEYTNTSGAASTTPMTIASDKGSASVSITDVDFATTMQINGTSRQKADAPTFVNNVAYTDYTYTGSDHQYILTLTVQNKYYISGEVVAVYTSYSTGNSVSVSLATSSDTLTARGVLPDVDEHYNITISGSTTARVIPTSTLSNCTISTSLKEWYKQGDTIAVTLQANENCYFNASSSNIVRWFDASGLAVQKAFAISEDTHSATISVTLPTDYNITTFEVIGNATPESVVGQKYGSINVYKVTLDNLESFAQSRFFTENIGSTENVQYEQIDLGNYVNRIKRIYADVPTASTDVIKCGNYNTSISCYAPKSDVITIDFGTLAIPAPNANSLDYQSDIKAFLPFVGYVDLSSDYIGKTISLTYTINIVNGGGVAKVMCDDVPIIIQDVEPSQDILYRTSSEQKNVGADEWTNTLYYGLEPYAILTYYNSANDSDDNNDNVQMQLSQVSGYAEVNQVDLTTTDTMARQEEEEIIRLLSGGVYF